MRIDERILKGREAASIPTREERRLLKKKTKIAKKSLKIKQARLLKQKNEEEKLLKNNKSIPKKKTKIKRRKDRVKLFKKSKPQKKRKHIPVTRLTVSKTKRKEAENNLKTLDEQYRFGRMSRKSYNAIKKNLEEDLEKI